MKRKNKESKFITMTICGCLCALAVGAGLARQGHREQYQPPVTEDSKNEIRIEETQPAAASQTPKIGEEQKLPDVKSNDDGEQPTENKKPEEAEKAEPVFAYPVEGDIIMPYSTDTAIYDPTLEQYRTNASVSISAEAGERVTAAEAGRVKEITKDEERGTSVVIDHENGWLTTYSQLTDPPVVKVGQAVEKGQIIGKVDEPTKYTIALGSHVEFAVEKDGESVDPKEAIDE